MSQAALRGTGLSKAFYGVRAVSDVSFEIADGALVALIGPNGAGKTTLFNLITNFYPPDAGEVWLYGESLAALPPAAIAKRGLIRTFQTARIFPAMTALDNVLVGAHLHLRAGAFEQMLWAGRARREERASVARGEALLDLVGLSAYRDVAATELPMGSQKLLEVARALMASPHVLLLDEPAAGLNDAETAELATLLRAVRGTGITILVVEHNMSLVMGVADRVIVLDAGAVVTAGTPDEIQRDPRVIEAYVGRDEKAA